MTDPILDPLERINPRNYLRDKFVGRMRSDARVLNQYEHNPVFHKLVTMIYRGADDDEIVDRIIVMMSQANIDVDQIPNMEEMVEAISAKETERQHEKIRKAASER